MLQLAAASGLKTVPLSTSSAVTAGEKALALGNAQGHGGTPAAATGTITALGQSITATDQAAGISEQLTGLIQTDVPLQPGDSGGPLVSPAGQVTGEHRGVMQCQISRQARTFAIPASRAPPIAAAIGLARPRPRHNRRHRLPRRPGRVVRRPGARQPRYRRLRRRRDHPRHARRPDRTDTWRRDRVDRRARLYSAMSLRSVIDAYRSGDTASLSWVDQDGQAHTATIVFTAGPAC